MGHQQRGHPRAQEGMGSAWWSRIEWPFATQDLETRQYLSALFSALRTADDLILWN
jgi:hypothetical protein